MSAAAVVVTAVSLAMVERPIIPDGKTTETTKMATFETLSCVLCFPSSNLASRNEGWAAVQRVESRIARDNERIKFIKVVRAVIPSYFDPPHRVEQRFFFDPRPIPRPWHDQDHHNDPDNKHNVAGFR